MPRPKTFSVAFQDRDSLQEISDEINNYAIAENVHPISTSIMEYDLFGQKFSAIAIFECNN